MDRLFPYLDALKHAVDRIDPVLVERGDRIEFDGTTGVLRVPRSVADRAPTALAELVLDALIAATAALPVAAPVRGRARELVRELVNQDRDEERQAVDSLRTAFAAVPAVRPTADQWATLAVELQAVVLEDVRTRWEGLARSIPGVAAMPDDVDREVLADLVGAFREDVELLHTLHGRTAVPRPLVARLIDLLGGVTPYLVRAREGQRPELADLDARLKKLL